MKSFRVSVQKSVVIIGRLQCSVTTMTVCRSCSFQQRIDNITSSSIVSPKGIKWIMLAALFLFVLQKRL